MKKRKRGGDGGVRVCAAFVVDVFVCGPDVLRPDHVRGGRSGGHESRRAPEVMVWITAEAVIQIGPKMMIDGRPFREKEQRAAKRKERGQRQPERDFGTDHARSLMRATGDRATSPRWLARPGRRATLGSLAVCWLQAGQFPVRGFRTMQSGFRIG